MVSTALEHPHVRGHTGGEPTSKRALQPGCMYYVVVQHSMASIFSFTDDVLEAYNLIKDLEPTTPQVLSWTIINYTSSNDVACIVIILACAFSFSRSTF